MSYIINIVSDCGGQAMSRMMTRYHALHPDAKCIPYESASLLEAAGNIVDAIDALAWRAGAIVCNSAPRRAARATNGSAIVYVRLGQTIIVSTVGVLGLLKKLVPELTAQAVNVDTFIKNLNVDRHTFNFRGLEVIPFILRSLRDGDDMNTVSTPHTTFPKVEPCVWLVDIIEGRLTNLKLSILQTEVPWFSSGNKVLIQFGDQSVRQLTCYDRLTDIPDDEPGIYEGSSGFNTRRFLEVAIMGGSAAITYNVPQSGTQVSISRLEK